MSPSCDVAPEWGKLKTMIIITVAAVCGGLTGSRPSAKMRPHVHFSLWKPVALKDTCSWHPPGTLVPSAFTSPGPAA